MKNYTEFILEFVKNEKYAEYILNKLTKDVDKKLFRNTQKNIYCSTNYTSCVFYDILNDEINKILSIIKKYKNYLEKIGVVLSYDINNHGEIYNNVYLYYKDLYIERFNPPRYMYHSTLLENVDNILKIGLIPQKHSDSSDWNKNIELEYPPAIFAVTKRIWQSGGVKDCLIRIDTSKINNKWWRDLNIPTYDAYMTFEAISPDALDVVDIYSLNPIK